MNDNIQEALQVAIEEAHTKAEASTVDARGRIDAAINERLTCAQLVEKASRLHKQDVRGYLSSIMSGEQVKAYLSLHDAAKKRPTLQDKRQLLLAGILDMQEPRDVTKHAQGTPSFLSNVTRFIGKLNKTVSKRPIDDWSESEREQMKDVMKPMVDIWQKL